MGLFTRDMARPIFVLFVSFVVPLFSRRPVTLAIHREQAFGKKATACPRRTDPTSVANLALVGTAPNFAQVPHFDRLAADAW